MAVLGIGRRWIMAILAATAVIIILALSGGHEKVASVLDSSFASNFVSFDSVDSDSETADCEVAATETEINWKTINVTSMTPEQIVQYFLWTNQTSCKLSHDFGGVMLKNPSGFDGQKAVCLDPKVAPKAGRCVIYSFGINYEWSFDDAMEKYGCKVFSFDPSMKEIDHNHSKAVSFYNLGLGDKDTSSNNGWKYKTLSSIYSMLEPIHGKNVIIDYLKIDIESWEWSAIPNIIETGMLAKVRQLGVEFHWSPKSDLQNFRQRVNIVKAIEDAGMIRFDSKYNPWFKGHIPALNNYEGSLGYEIAWYQILP